MTSWTLFVVALAVAAICIGASAESPAERYWWRKGNWTSSFHPSEALFIDDSSPDHNQVQPTNYVCRALEDGERIPGTYTTTTNQCHVGVEGKEVTVPQGNFEILKQDAPERYQWHGSEGGQLMNGSVVGGFARNQEPYFICRAEIPGEGRLAGKLQPSTRVCRLPWQGGEKGFDKYDVLQEHAYFQ